MKILPKNSKKISHSLLILTLFIAFFSSIKNSYATTATDYGVGRTRSCAISDGETEGLHFSPSDGGKDAQFLLSNPICLTVIATTYATVKTAIFAMNHTCGTGGSLRVIPSPILDAIDISKAAAKAASTLDGKCAGTVAFASSAYGIALAQLRLIYDIADNVYNNTRVCGSNWTKANTSTYNMSAADYKQVVQLTIDGYLEDETANSANLSFDNQKYREWYYGGVEVEDNPEQERDACRDPAQENCSYDNCPKQKYYLQGLEQGNYNCQKYKILAGQDDPVTGEAISSSRLADFEKAYACCLNRSQNYICLENTGSYDITGGHNLNDDDNDIQQHFCKAGTKCVFKGVTFETKALDSDRLICAESYSLCPYNFAISGGSEYCDYYQDGKWSSAQKRWILITEDDISSGNCTGKSEVRNADCTYNEKAGKCKNYCQYLTHCTKVSNSNYEYKSELGSPYFSDACINFVGDSQNRTRYNAGFLLGKQRHFSAPIAQCMRESIENLFFNVAGHSECLSYNEAPSADGICPSGEYITDGNFIYKKGNQVKTESFFSSIQNTLQNIVKLVITLSIMFYGMNLMIGKADAREKKDILVYLVKIALVLYFATGDAWQGMFFKGIHGASSEFSRMIFKIQANDDEKKRDGCQFGEVALSDGTPLSSTYSYPSGKEYLAIWDTLDCKIMRYLGFGPEVSAANIFSLIFAGFFTGAIGIYFALSVMFFGFFLIAMTIRALHIFLCSWMAIIMFVLISPITIPTALFARTKGIYNSWLEGLVSFCFQPIVLFAYIAIFVTIFDKVMIGSATFHGEPPTKTMSCKKFCSDIDGNFLGWEHAHPNCADETAGNKMVNPLDDSVACLIGINSFGKFPGFELIGISIPILTNIFEDNVKAKIKTLLKGALIMYLLYQFMDQIPGITSSLIGGTTLPSTSKTPGADPMGLFKTTAGAAREIQQRIMRGGRKAGESAVGTAKDRVRDVGDKGRSAPQAKPSPQADEVRNSSNTGDSSGNSSGGGDSSGNSSNNSDSTGKE